MDMNTNTNMNTIMDKQLNKNLCLLQFFGSTFPVGGFQHSYGLETYISNGEVKNAQQLKQYILETLRQVYVTFDGRAFCRAWQYGRDGEIEPLRKLDAEITAMRLSGESRRASLKTGKALLRMAVLMTGEQKLSEYRQVVQGRSNIGNYCVVAGFLSGRLDAQPEAALQAFYFSDMNNLLQVGIKTIPLGQTEGQQLLYELYPKLNAAVEKTIQNQNEELENFVPYMNLMSMQHETLYSRLYMS